MVHLWLSNVSRFLCVKENFFSRENLLDTHLSMLQCILYYSLRLADIEKQNRNLIKTQTQNCQPIGKQNHSPEPEKYLKEIDYYLIRRQTVKFRISNHSLMTEKKRQHGIQTM